MEPKPHIQTVSHSTELKELAGRLSAFLGVGNGSRGTAIRPDHGMWVGFFSATKHETGNFTVELTKIAPPKVLGEEGKEISRIEYLLDLRNNQLSRSVRGIGNPEKLGPTKILKGKELKDAIEQLTKYADAHPPSDATRGIPSRKIQLL